MRAQSLGDLLRGGDRVAVSNITGREASKVSVVSQRYCGNVVAGWALGKAGKSVEVPGAGSIPVFGQFDEMLAALPEARRPNKIIVYSPPEAVYGDVKEAIDHCAGSVETIYVITEHVSVEVTAKLRAIASQANIDILGCNTLGIINVHDRVRIGAIGGDSPDETFQAGSACIISNSGNMVNTIATYIRAAGLGVSFGISTGKDVLILTPMKDLLRLAMEDPCTKVIILYVEPGGAYEEEAIEYLRSVEQPKPVLVYVSGQFAEGTTVSLGHAGAVVEGSGTSATAKAALFDDYFGVPVFDADNPKRCSAALAANRRGVRVNALHDLVPAASAVLKACGIGTDFRRTQSLELRPWFADYGSLERMLPADLALHPLPAAAIPEPYGPLVERFIKSGLGRIPARQSMRNTSHASSNDGATPRIYGWSVMNLMRRGDGAFAESVLLYWLGHPPKHRFEVALFEMCLVASLTNGPGTISSQGAKLSASAGNQPNTAMIATLASIGTVHGGNGQEAARMLVDVFAQSGLVDPYDREGAPDLDAIVKEFIQRYAARKTAARDAGLRAERIPCLGHPVFNRDAVNYDPRERVISEYLEQVGVHNVFLDFYHRLARGMTAAGLTNKVHAVNVDAAITCVLMGIAWPLLVEKKITVERAVDLPFLTFALGRCAGGAGEYLDHRESGTDMDMRVPIGECVYLGRLQD